MPITDLPIANAVIQALGWTLIHFLWQGVILTGIYWAVCTLARPDRAVLRYWTGMVCLLLALLVPVLTFAIYYTAAPAPDAGVAVVAGGASHVALGAPPSAWAGLSAAIEPALPLVVLRWGAGVLVLSTRTAVGWMGTRRLVRHGVLPVSEQLQAVTAALAERLGVRRAVSVLRSTRVRVPTVIGWLKPVILLPAGVLARLPSEQLEMIIAHELGHVRRNDYLFNFLQLRVETLLFYHPAIRWMSRSIREQREQCCDDLVVSRCGRPVLYARALAALEELREPVPIGAMAATTGDLLMRVRRIVGADLPRNSAGFAQVALMLVLTVVAGASAQHGLDIGRSAESAPGARAELASVVPSLPAPLAHGRLAHDALSPAPVEPVVTLKAKIGTPAPAPASVAETKVESPVTDHAPEPVVWSAQRRVTWLADASDTLFDASADAVEVAPAEAEAEPEPPRVIKPTVVEPPRYPNRARSKGIEGYVKLSFSLDDRGRVRDIEVADAYPEGVFDRAAKRALKRWRFEGAGDLADGLRLSQTFDFTLHDVPVAAAADGACSRTGRRTCSSFYHNMHVVYVNPPAGAVV
ncbi:MAG: M56 family metallopeptidase, partial [Xanthomonadales bacterium]|nr:M56 family metallopeptidase [Xanthomonadales bacterium]